MTDEIKEPVWRIKMSGADRKIQVSLDTMDKMIAAANDPSHSKFYWIGEDQVINLDQVETAERISVERLKSEIELENFELNFGLWQATKSVH